MALCFTQMRFDFMQLEKRYDPLGHLLNYYYAPRNFWTSSLIPVEIQTEKLTRVMSSLGPSEGKRKISVLQGRRDVKLSRVFFHEYALYALQKGLPYDFSGVGRMGIRLTRMQDEWVLY